jgi:DNA-binding NtrC family response regulator
MKLLVVDDCADIVKILSSFLELSDHEVDKAHNGIEAIKLLRNNFYDVVITDAEMPEMDGIELCKFIKSRFPAIYIIGTSGSFHALKELKKGGADICFPKPFHIDDMEKAIENLFLSHLSDLDSPTAIDDSSRLSGRFLMAV